jgi:hypothetical protein
VGVFEVAGVKNPAVYSFLGLSFIFSFAGFIVLLFIKLRLESKIEQVEVENDLSYFMHTRGYGKSEIDAALKELDGV